MSDVKEFLDHFCPSFYKEKERVTQEELNAYLDVANDIFHRCKCHPNPKFFINGQFVIDYLSNKDLHDLDFTRQRTIPGIKIKNSILRCANLSCCSFNGTDFSGSDLTAANLYGAGLARARLNMVKGLPAMACPEEGGFIGWKKAEANTECGNFRIALIKLYIPARASRSSATTNKCRASEAFVLDIVDLLTEEELDCAVSLFDSEFKYHKGEWVKPDPNWFDANRWDECASGIHFFIDKQSVIEY